MNDKELDLKDCCIECGHIYYNCLCTHEDSDLREEVTKILFRQSIAEEGELQIAQKYFDVIESRCQIKSGDEIICRYSALPYYKELERDFEQTNELHDMVEVAYFYDIENKNYTIFAGTQATVLEEYSGDDYPFIKDDEPYIPVSQFICQPSSEGFYNYGVGSMLFDLAVVQQQLMNLAIGHAEDNVYPITLINVPEGESAKFFNKLKMAHEMRSVGKKGYVSMEYDPNNPNSSQVQAQQLLTQSLYQEWQIIYDRLDREIQRLDT